MSLEADKPTLNVILAHLGQFEEYLKDLQDMVKIVIEINGND